MIVPMIVAAICQAPPPAPDVRINESARRAASKLFAQHGISPPDLSRGQWALLTLVTPNRIRSSRISGVSAIRVVSTTGDHCQGLPKGANVLYILGRTKASSDILEVSYRDGSSHTVRLHPVSSFENLVRYSYWALPRIKSADGAKRSRTPLKLRFKAWQGAEVSANGTVTLRCDASYVEVVVSNRGEVLGSAQSDR